MKYKHKISPQVHKDIIAIAQELPPLQKLSKQGKPLFRAVSKFVKGSDLPANVKIKGQPEPKVRTMEELLSERPALQDERVGPDPNKMYIRHGREPILVNHKLNLIDSYQNEGPEGMKRYVASVKAIFQKAVDAENAKLLTEQSQNHDNNQ